MRVYEIDIVPMGCVRMTRYGKFKDKYAQRYLANKAQVQFTWQKQHKGDLLKGPLEVNLIFSMPIPKNGRSQNRKVASGDWHTTKPDSDNLQKSAFDAANKIVWEDDNQVCKVSCIKVYGDVPGIRMEVREL